MTVRGATAPLSTALLLAGAAACATRPAAVPEPATPRPAASAASEKPPFSIQRANDVVAYDGELLAEGLAALVRDEHGLRILMIRSGGGSIEVGMDFGEWVLARGLAVVVQDYCLSSCANYVFVAGHSKAVLRGGVVAWHGSARQADVEAQIERAIAARALSKEDAAAERAKAFAFRDRVRARQDAFFQRVAVDECVTRIGNVRLGARGLFSMSVRDMKRFGIDGVVEGPEREQDIPLQQRAKLGITFVHIADDLDPRTACE
jgi:hypothetical protein